MHKFVSMHNPKYSVIVPVYNRPDEVDELLDSLTCQDYKSFEVIIVEDGSAVPCEDIVRKYTDKLTVTYFTKQNSGPGTTRNFGAERANGEYFIFFDSDCIIPPTYFTEVEDELAHNRADAFGGPDRAHHSFTNIQKAINYSMTSVLTTGGIRGGAERMDKFHPRSFNMGISREVFEKTGGFSTLRFGEDIDFSLRILEAGFATRLFTKAFVYHKRRTDFRKFYRQIYNSGIARINLSLLHRGTLKLVHLLPSAFCLGMIFCIVVGLIFPYFWVFPILFSFLVFVNSLLINRNLSVAMLSVPASWVQLCGYGLGFIEAFWKRVVLKRNLFSAFSKNFYS